MTAVDAAWIAGLLEGEGSFGFSKTRTGNVPRIILQMTDRDTVEKYARLIGGVAVHPRAPWRPHYKPAFVALAHGRRAVGVMMMIYALMGDRRRARIREVVLDWRSRRAALKKGTVCACKKCGRETVALSHKRRGRVCEPCSRRMARSQQRKRRLGVASLDLFPARAS